MNARRRPGHGPTLHRRAFALLTAGLAAALPGAASARGPDFAQIDASSDSSTLVLVRALGDPRAADPAPLLTAAVSRWSGGEAGGVAAVKRVALLQGVHSVMVGAGVGADGWRSRSDTQRDGDAGASLRAQAEGVGTLASARYYALAQVSTFRDTWFATAQLEPRGAPLAIELSRFGERSYHATTATLRLPVGAPGWSLRLGAVRDGEGRRLVVGIGYNGF